jgi:hypothetical protein
MAAGFPVKERVPGLGQVVPGDRNLSANPLDSTAVRFHHQVMQPTAVLPGMGVLPVD